MDDGSTLQRDELGQALVPDDIPLLKKTLRFIACKSTGNGDCFYNSCSRLLVGDDSLSSCLRMLTALELVTNSEYYAQHPKASLKKQFRARITFTLPKRCSLFSYGGISMTKCIPES